MAYYDEIHPTPVIDAREALLCARLNLRGAKRLLLRGLHRRGISALYDSVLFGMHYYVAQHDDCTDVDLADAAGVFHLLTRVGVFDDSLTFNRFSLIVERVLWQESYSFDADAVLVDVELMLRKLGVMTSKAKSKIPH